MQKLLNHMKFREVKQGEFLYTKGEASPDFYFLLKGRMEIVVESSSNNEFKFSKGIDEYDFFGKTP